MYQQIETTVDGRPAVEHTFDDADQAYDLAEIEVLLDREVIGPKSRDGGETFTVTVFK